MPIRLALIAAVAALPFGTAAQAEGWTQREAGITLPDRMADLSRGETRDLSDGKATDTMLQYGAGEEPVTLYVYRSTYPNAALWMDRTAAAMQTNVGGSGAETAAVPFTIGGALRPNGLRRALNLPQGARFKATGVAMAQVGAWMLKLRVTSATLDAASVSAKMDRILQAVRFDRPAPAPLPMTAPAACGEEPILAGRLVAAPDRKRIAAARDAGRAVLAMVRGGGDGLAARPDLWCRDESTGLPAQYVSLYRRKTGGSYVLLLSDAGLSLTLAALPAGDGSAVAAYAGTTSDVGVAALYEGLPDPTTAMQAALPLMVGRQSALAVVRD